MAAQSPATITVTIPQAAALLNIGRTLFYHLARTDPTFPKVLKFGKASRILVEDLQCWARQQASLAEPRRAPKVPI